MIDILHKIKEFLQNAAIGIDLTDEGSDVAEIVLQNGEILIKSLQHVPPNVKPLDFTDSKEQGKSASALKSSDVLVRALDIKLSKKKDIDAVLAFQAEPLLPYPADEAVLDYQEISTSKSGGSALTLLSARKEALQFHLDDLKEIGIIPEIVSSRPLALASFASYMATLSANELPVVVIHVNENKLLCILSLKGKLLSNFSLPFGINILEAALAKDLGDNKEKAKQDILTAKLNESSYPNLSKAAQDFKQGVSRTIFALAKQTKTQEVGEILLTGKGASIALLPKLLSEGLKSPISQPSARFGQESKQIEEFAIPIGLALSALKDESPVNFRKKEFAYPDPWKRQKLPIALYFVACLFTSLAIFLFANSWEGKKLDHIKTEYIDFLSVTGKPFEVVEKQYEAKNPYSHEAGESPETILKSMSANSLMGRLEFIQDQIHNAPETFALYPDIPRVSDVLAWLAKHPKVVSKEGKPLINISSFAYSIVKKPDNRKMTERYQAKIEMEFTTETSTQAREFHDALIAHSDLVDPKEEVKWGQSGDVYRTSFFLRNRPPRLIATPPPAIEKMPEVKPS